MLKRRRVKIQKYISTLKKKHNKKNAIQNHVVLQNRISQLGQGQVKLENKQPKMQQQNQMGMQIQIEQQNPYMKQGEIEEEEERPCWEQNDGQGENSQKEAITLKSKNKFRKLINFGLSSNTNVQEYEKKLGKFYKSKFNKINWAQEVQDVQQKDINDYLNQDVYFSDKKPQKKTIKFITKTSQKHDSIVSGLDWHKNVMFTTGLDHKIKVWHFEPHQMNPQLKLKQEKDIYVKDLPLSNCFYRDNLLLSGTLRKNFVVLDTEKWTPTFITSSFLKDHKTYQNFKISKFGDSRSAIFSDNRVSMLDKNHIYIGSLLANQPIQDVSFGSNNSILAVTNSSIYEWDSRKLQVISLHKKFLNFTCIEVSPTTVSVGSKLGTVYLYPFNPSLNTQTPIQNSNLVTHISHLCTSRQNSYTIALSKWKANAVRVIDSMTGKAIGNWPEAKTKIGLPMRAGFHSDDFFAVGNSHGFVSVYGFDHAII